MRHWIGFPYKHHHKQRHDRHYTTRDNRPCRCDGRARDKEGTGEIEAKINAGKSENSTDISSVIQELVDSYDYFAAFEDAEYEAPKRYSGYSMADSTGGGPDITLPQVTIISPDGGRTYTTTEIALAVSANEPISVSANEPISRWSYSNGADPVPFSPNITIAARVGNNSLVVFAEDMVGNVGSASVSFYLESFY
jgi:hypothetical protein